ncbi:phosphoglycerate kinase [Zea mays]|uniref:Phosphoglycerate kinase n=2 Tax=Zea mays TaxID=4577 RepID=C0HHJ4_MAIZE|nr:phosphoglycerate kinase [Zea mays]ACN26497.1 unknown [Zea mays]|eukprot:NP_001167912.1 phosphoglycerate kinase [Zea mays]
MASALVPASFSLAHPAARRPVNSTGPAAMLMLRRAGLATVCPPERSLGSDCLRAGADPRLAIHVALRCRSASSTGRGTRAAATMTKKSVGDLTAADLEGKRVLVRADLNVPLDDSQNITDDTRVRAAIPTIKHLISNGARVILTSHLQELDYLVGAVSNPKRPFAAVIGGSKVSSKIGVIESLLEKCDILLLGGGMIFTFYKAQGHSIGSSLVEDDKLELATSLLRKAKEKGVSLMLPFDLVVADKFAPDASSQVVPASAIPDAWMGLDIGPDSISAFSSALETTQTVIWNGPMGVFEFDKFAVGTKAIAKKLAELSGKGVTTIVGGGDSIAAVEKVGVADSLSHISTGGGASLELLEGKELPGVAALDEA